MDFSALLNNWLDHHPPVPKEENPTDERTERKLAAARRAELRRRRPEATLDLHGLTSDEALQRTDMFLRESKSEGKIKILIIHGKGIHTKSGESVLRDAVRAYVRSHPLAGESGVPDRDQGGEGATWVILR